VLVIIASQITTSSIIEAVSYLATLKPQLIFFILPLVCHRGPYCQSRVPLVCLRLRHTSISNRQRGLRYWV